IYRGEVMEAGTVTDIFGSPAHPYLKALLKAVPNFDMRAGERLKALREVPVQAGALLGASNTRQRKSGGILLNVRNVSKSFSTRQSGWFGKGDAKEIRAVDNVSFDIKHGECFGLVGDSGGTKTTVSKIIMRAVTPDEGSISFDSTEGQVELLDIQGEELKRLRRRIQMVFQDPFSSLSPRMTVQNILSEPLEIHHSGTAGERKEVVERLMQAVGLDPRYLSRYPHSFSGGQRQRIGIARALAL